MEAIDCDKDHIHLLSGTHPKIELDRIVQIFKRITAHEIFRRKPAALCAKGALQWRVWAEGYHVAAVG